MSAEGKPNVEAQKVREKKKADIAALETRRDELKAILDEQNEIRAGAVARAREVLPEYNGILARLEQFKKPKPADEDAPAA